MKENKISEFNFKLLHNLLPNRYNLFKWKLYNNPLCLYDDQLHDNLHLFVKCKHTRLFWLKFGDIIRKLYNVNFSFDKFVLIEGYNLKNKIFKSLNFLIIYAKYAVYLTFMQAENRKLMFHEVSILCIFKTLIHNRLKIERNCKTKKLCIFVKHCYSRKRNMFYLNYVKMLRLLFQLIVYDCLICSKAYIYQ